PERREAIEETLQMAAQSEGERGRWANDALTALKACDLPAVGASLERCAADPDLFLRKLAALALTYWDGPQVEPTLVQLANHTGQGGTPDSEDVHRLEIRYQATLALARRGSKHVDSRLDVLRDMLDQDELEKQLRKIVNGENVPDLDAVVGTI